MLNDFLGYLIIKAGLQVKNTMRRVYSAERFEITPEQWAILHSLSENDGQPQRYLAETLLKQKPNITRLTDILEEKGFAVRKSDEKDRRVFNVYITKSGRKIADEILQKTQDRRIDFYKKLTDEETETLKILLQKLID